MAILTISRQYGSGGGEIGRIVARSLGYEYVDKEKILEDIKAVGQKWEKWGKELDEHRPSTWEKYDWSFRGFGALVQGAILTRALGDRAVIVGRGGNFLLHGIPHSLRIRVVAPMEERVSRVSTRESVDLETARWLVQRTDHERACFLYALYGKRWEDAVEYDAVLDTGVRTVEQTALIVQQMLMEREGLLTDESSRLLRMRALAAKIKAGLLTAQGPFISVLDVFYDAKELVLRGIVRTPKERRRIEDAARTLAGDRCIRCELHYRG